VPWRAAARDGGVLQPLSPGSSEARTLSAMRRVLALAAVVLPVLLVVWLLWANQTTGGI
jgi:hypothetical protein